VIYLLWRRCTWGEGRGVFYHLLLPKGPEPRCFVGVLRTEEERPITWFRIGEGDSISIEADEDWWNSNYWLFEERETRIDSDVFTAILLDIFSALRKGSIFS